MNTKALQSLVAGIAATVVMTIVMMIAPMMGMAKMNPPAMVSGMMGMPIAVGWVMHFIIGIVFAASYVYFFRSILPIGNNVLKGVVFGIIIAILAKIGMTVMGAMAGGGTPETEGSMVPMIMALVLGHVIFGIVTALVAKEPKIAPEVSA